MGDQDEEEDGEDVGVGVGVVVVDEEVVVGVVYVGEVCSDSVAGTNACVVVDGV